MGGRAAEEIVFGEITTGAEDDLEHATVLARQMVCMYGMGHAVGLVHCAQRGNPFLYRSDDGLMQRDCSEQTAREIDEEVKKILDAAYAEARQILQQHRDKVDLVASELLYTRTRLTHLRMDTSIRGQNLIIAKRVRFAREVGHHTTSLADQKHSCRRVPEMQT